MKDNLPTNMQQMPAPQDMHAETPRSDSDTANSTNSTLEIVGTAGPEPTRYGDWEKMGRCIDF